MKNEEQALAVNILLADDDIDDCGFFREVLADFLSPTHLTAVNDGEQLMKFLHNTNELPHILFLDLNMPRKNGFECLSEIKLATKLKHFPVVIFSTSFEQEVVNQLYQNGAQYFIRKPPDFSKFRKIIHHAIPIIMNGTNSQPIRENFVLTV